MPVLDWIGKEAVVRHHQEVPTRLLEPVPCLSCAPEGSSPEETGNLIVQGDNLHALKALLPRYAGQVKCIYIDPPYNTGNEGWIYNDNTNSPEIKKWLGETVGREAEDLCRHDKWLCMMYPRLVLLRQFLREDGAIFISLDDNEIASLRCVMDEIFGQKELFDEQVLLDSDWEIDSFDFKLEEVEFPKNVEELRRVRIGLSKTETIVVDPYRELRGQMDLRLQESGWTQELLVSWLDSQIPFVYASRPQKAAWLNGALEYLQKVRGFLLEELAYRKYRLRGALDRKLKDGLKQVKQRQFRELLDETEFLIVDPDKGAAAAFQNGRYAYDRIYAGPIRLQRHFFPVVGNLPPAGEEFQCAEFIANEWEEVDCWVRNVERKPDAFWLPTSSDRFYPDFVIRLKDGRLVVVEYKGEAYITNDDSEEKNRIGKLWAERSGGKGLFFLIGKGEWKQLPGWIGTGDLLRINKGVEQD